jgi:hypothetical protein
MSTIPKLLATIPHERKRTGVILAKSAFEEVVAQAQRCGFTIIDCASWYQQTLLFTDDQLLQKLLEVGKAGPCLLLSLETFIAPRIGHGGEFLENLSSKLAVAEPHFAVVMLFYSTSIFKKINAQYELHPLTKNHTLNLLAGDNTHSYD